MRITRSGDRAIKKYSARIRNARRGSPADETEEILKSVREHLDEALRQLGKEMVDAADVREVLATLAPPESYATGGSGADQGMGGARLMTLAYMGLACLGAAIVIPLLTTLVLAIFQSRESSALSVAFIAAAGLLLVAMIMGILSFRHPAGKAALFCSAAILIAAASVFSISFSGRTVTTSEQQPSVESVPSGG